MDKKPRFATTTGTSATMATTSALDRASDETDLSSVDTLEVSVME